MTTIGAERVIEQFGSPLAVAEAMLEGRLHAHDQRFLWEIVPKTSPIWEAAKIRAELRLNEVSKAQVVLVKALQAIVKHVFADLPVETSPPRNRLQVVGSIAQLALDEYHDGSKPKQQEDETLLDKLLNQRIDEEARRTGRRR